MIDPTDPMMLEFAPLIYVAWSDGLLTDEELSLIRARMARRPISPALREVLDEWLNPAQPPTPAQLYQLLETIRENADPKQPRRKWFRRREHASTEPEEHTPELIALHEIEQALGVSGENALRAILGEQDDHGKLAPRLDAEEVALFVDAERYDIRRYVFNVLQRSVFDRSGIDDIDHYRARVLEWCAELARLGMSAYGYPEEFEGENNIAKSIAAFETLAYHDLSLLVKFGVQFGLFGGSILQLGTRKHHERYLRAVAKLELPGCFAMTETGHGSNVRDIMTTASYDVATHEFVIDTPSRPAWKDYIGNAGLHARMATVFAQLEVNGKAHGVHAFLVPLRDEGGAVLPGVTIEDCGQKIGLNGVDNGRIAFDSVRIPRDNLLDRFASVSEAGVYSSEIESPSRRFFTMLGTLVAGRISIAAAACSASKYGLTIAARYAQRRTQFGPEGKPEVPIASYQAVQRGLMPLMARTYALDLAIHDAIRALTAVHKDTQELELRAAALKAAASQHAVAALQYSRELCGGQGYMWANRIGELRADTDVFTTFEGANNVLLLLVAKGLLTELREDFEEMRVWAAVKDVTARAGTAVAELNPVITRKTDEEHLRDPEFHMSALRYREQRLLRSAAARMRHLLGQGRDAFAAVNECELHLLKLGEAHADVLALESFQHRVARAVNGGTQQLMTQLCTLFALSVMEDDRGWFLESGYFEPAKSKAIRTQVVQLCHQLHQHAELIADGWGIPARYLPEIARQ